MRKLVGMAAAAVASVVVLSSCALPMEDLGGAWSIAADINEVGVVAGSSDTPLSTPGNAVVRGFRRLADGTVVELAPLAGHTSSMAGDIDDAGTIAGISYTVPPPISTCGQAGLSRAVTWAPSGAITDLGVLPGGCYSEPRDVNGAGVVVGLSNVGSFAFRAFVYDPAVGHMVQLPSLPLATTTIAEAINDSGKVVGRQWLPSGTRTVIWDLAAGTVTDVQDQVGLEAISDINEAGVIAGANQIAQPDGSTAQEAAIWIPGTTGPTPLGTGPRSTAASVNDDGVVVGNSNEVIAGPPGPIVTPPQFVPHMFRWTAEGGAVDLAGPDHPSKAIAINDAGTIVGDSDSRAAFFFENA